MINLDPLSHHVRSQREAMVASLRELVEHESPSLDKAALDPLALKIAERWRAVGGQVEIVPNADGGNHVLGRFEGQGGRPLLVLGHYDTVWPMGTLANMPFRIEDGIARGPGVYDMKASLVILEYAFKAIHACGLTLPGKVVVLWTSDEEVGSRTSRHLIETLARESAAALVLEPPLVGGRLKTGRKGVGQFQLEIKGRAAHAGVEPEKGISAIVELAHQILALEALARPNLGTTINVGVVEGGTTSNVVPERASAVVDVRVTSSDETARIEQAMNQLAPVLNGIELRVTGGMNRPPMERTPASGALFERVRTIGAQLGLDLGEGSTGGGSDGNFTAAVGTPTLDGLGTDGRGAHAVDEQIKIDSLVERTTLLASLLLEIYPAGNSHE